MIDFEQLKQLITIAEKGTLSLASESLFISQPALTRSMQRLETDLGVTLFFRKKNKIELNENGKLAYELALNLSDEFDQFKKRIQDFDKKNKTIFIGTCAPTPIQRILPKITNRFFDKAVSYEMKDIPALIKGLFDETYQISILNKPIDDERVVSYEFFSEKLFLCLPKNHPLTRYKGGIYFKEIGKINMLLFSHIGFWHDMVLKTMPETHFILQTDRNDLMDLIKESNLPCFTTDFVLDGEDMIEDRINIPILDKEAVQTFYCHILKKNKDELGKIFL